MSIKEAMYLPEDDLILDAVLKACQTRTVTLMSVHITAATASTLQLHQVRRSSLCTVYQYT